MERMPGVALVTGAARRIGAAIARALAEDGFAIAVHYQRSRPEAEVLVDEIVAAGGRAMAFRADLAHEGEVRELAAAVIAALGPIGLLVNNASSFLSDTPRDSPPEVFARILATDLRAPMVLTGAVAEALPRGMEALVVNLVDARILSPTPHYASYTVAKAGLWAFTEVAALALAPRIRVVAIAPGLVLPPDDFGRERFARLVHGSPLGRPVDMAEIVEAVRFCLRCRSLTGTMLVLDAGWHMLRNVPRGMPTTDDGKAF